MNKNYNDKLHPGAGETLVKFFVRSIKEDKSTKNILNVLSILNSYILSQPVSKCDEIFEFGNYFVYNGYEEQTRKAREKEFQKEIFILDKFYDIADRKERQVVQETVKDLSYQERQSAMSLADKIFNVTLSFGDSEVIEFSYKKVMLPNDIQALRYELFCYLAYVIHKFKNAGIVVRIMKRSEKPLLAGISIKNRKWRLLPVYEFMEYVDELDLTVQYTELPMRK